LALRLGVELLAERHDVDASLTEGRTDRRRGVGSSGGDLELDDFDDFLGHDFTGWGVGLRIKI
jgi:hypothetical protein